MKRVKREGLYTPEKKNKKRKKELLLIMPIFGKRFFMQAGGINKSIKANNILICYDDLGTGNVPVIFIHGFPFDKSMWQPQVDFLKSSYRVIAYDIRGFGKSTADREKASITLYADDLLKMMDALQIPKAVICGLSMGGYIALNAVNRFPGRFEAIILSDTQCNADSPEAREKRYKTIHQVETEGLNDFAEAFVKNIFCGDSLADKKGLVEKIKKIVLSTLPQTITGTLTALAERWESCSGLNSIAVPALVLCGKEDVITPLGQSEFIHRNIKHSSLKILDHAGHLSNLEQPDEFNRHLNNFISGFSK